MSAPSTIAEIIGRFIGTREDPHGAQAGDARTLSPKDYARRGHICLLDGLKALNERNEEAAFEALNTAFIAYRQAQDGKAASLVQKTISLLIQSSRKPQVVRAAFRSAQRALAQAGLFDEVVRLLMFNAEFEAGQGDFTASENWFIEAIQIAADHHDDIGRVEALCRRAIVAADRGKSSDCKKWVAKAKEVASFSSDPNARGVFDRWGPKALAPRSVNIGALSRKKV